MVPAGFGRARTNKKLSQGHLKITLIYANLYTSNGDGNLLATIFF